MTDYQRLDTRVGNLEAVLYGERSYAQAITNVSSSLANVSTSLANVSSSLSSAISTNTGQSTSLSQISSSLAGVSTSLGGVSTSLGNVSSSVSSTASTIATYGNVVVQNTGTSGANVPLLNGTNTWSNPQTFSGFGFAITINGAAGTFRDMVFQTAGVSRWDIQADNTTESGSNAGSNFVIERWSDAGTAIDHPLTISRATGLVTFLDNIALTPTAFASLPASPTTGQRAFINNSNVAASGNFGAAAAGGGGNAVPVYYDGAAWRIG